ncbi:LLM class flavin-dependent oxidoreductase [Nonomuraea phyllanthi]|uniref:LLM class flavin-dependent oxidoreductase n=1 Tax=Nonomuraea phyllanthi TaxID=2219224 RepID=A0A5C4WWC7_9ACTN|nr:LLM class flavin-dependent oxidoreductase [Nonomuraea phyllanthi]KAB8197145.1 LLM class flavin-dependent oxidoreductase [Nonomuraea phyllanthi]QFY06852.1 LLM class flavin-dependent oxidoreductase [Nonomuraea phyllanthi]
MTPYERRQRLSLMFPAQPGGLDELMDFAGCAREVSARRLWMGQSIRLDTYQAMAGLAGRMPGLPLGTGVTLTPLMHPYMAAMAARSVSALSQASFVAGFGPGAKEFQNSVLDRPFERPLKAVEEYVTLVRRLLDGEVVNHSGEHYTMRSVLIPVQAPVVEVGVGVLRPGMAKVAGRAADVAITWLAPPWYISDHLNPAFELGAKEADREPPRVAAVVHAAVKRRGRNLRRIVQAVVGSHLSAAHYTDMLRKAGLSVDPANPRQGAQELIDSGVFATGTPDEIAVAIERYVECGVDEVILNVGGVYLVEGQAAAEREIREIMEAWESRE